MSMYEILSKTRGVSLTKKGQLVNTMHQPNQKRFRSHFSSLLIDLCEYINTPKSLSVSLTIRYLDDIDTSDLKKIYDVNPNLYLDVDSYRRDAQACALMKKTTMFGTRYDKTDLISFYKKSEEQAKTQRELLASRYPFEVYKQILACKGIIHTVLGALPVHVRGKFGPGSSYLLSGKYSSLQGKMVHRLECTPLAYDQCTDTIKNSMLYQHFSYTNQVHKFSPAFTLGVVRDKIIERVNPSIVPGDRFCIVEKDIFKPRAMCPQPTGNMIVQLGLAELLEKRFYRFSGIKLSEQDSVHKELVKCGSDIFGTIDLSDASDSISLALLEALLPRDWYEYIRSITCRQTRVDGKWYPNSKAFAQGCGITFIVETIIFYSIAFATVRRLSNQSNIRNLVSVYGDDILVPIHYTKDVIEALQLFSFVVNTKKSFGLDSYFKESCGTDTFRGVDVRPIYIKSVEFDYISLTVFTNQVSRIIEHVTCIDDMDAAKVWYRFKLLFELTGIKPFFCPIGCGDEEGIGVSQIMPSYTNQICSTRVIKIRRRSKEIKCQTEAFYLYFAGHTGRLFTRESKPVWFGLRSRPFMQRRDIV